MRILTVRILPQAPQLLTLVNRIVVGKSFTLKQSHHKCLCFSFKIYLASPISSSSHKKSHSPSASVIATHPKAHKYSPQHQQHRKLMTGALKLSYQSRSECSSSDDNIATPHDLASGLQMVHNKTVAHPGGLIAEEEIELSTPVPMFPPHKLIDYEDSIQTTTTTFSPKTESFDRETTGTSLSASTTIDNFDKEQSKSQSMRSRSYQGQSFTCFASCRCCQMFDYLICFLFSIVNLNVVLKVVYHKTFG